jgi:hypothetical protein
MFIFLMEMKALGYKCQYTSEMAQVGRIDIAEICWEVKTKL